MKGKRRGWEATMQIDPMIRNPNLISDDPDGTYWVEYWLVGQTGPANETARMTEANAESWVDGFRATMELLGAGPDSYRAVICHSDPFEVDV